MNARIAQTPTSADVKRIRAQQRCSTWPSRSADRAMDIGSGTLGKGMEAKE